MHTILKIIPMNKIRRINNLLGYHKKNNLQDKHWGHHYKEQVCGGEEKDRKIEQGMHYKEKSGSRCDGCDRRERRLRSP